LQQYIDQNLAAMTGDSQITIYGDRNQIVSVPGEARGGSRGASSAAMGKPKSFSTLFTYSTLSPYEQYSAAFDASVRSIRFARVPA